MRKQKVIIIGAGLAGSLLSFFLAKRGIETEIYEARGDMREEKMSAGRSINLALSDRGIRALSEVGMSEYMLKEAVPMYGRLIHPVAGETKFLPYSGREGEYINSVSRGGLNIALINEADNYKESRFFFHQRCVDFDCSTGEALIENTKTGERFTVKGETLIATDGAGSAVRRAMLNNRGCVERFDFSQDFLAHGYKELSIPPASELERGHPARQNADGEFLMEKNALHIWARHEFLMIALPNFDGSFTCTLFLAHESGNPRVSKGGNSLESDSALADAQASATEPSFEQLTDEKSLLEFFQTNFPDAIPLMPDLTKEFFTNPTGNLGTIKCFPWNVGGKALLLGDAAHAMVPFYGQGMNCAFEDCRILDSIMGKHNAENWEAIFEEFAAERKPNADAICDMAKENFYEMRDAVADPVFQKKRALETKLEQTFPDYFSKYSMVTFREDLPYAVAKEKGNTQDRLLMEICAEIDGVSEIDLNEVMQKVKRIT